MAEECNPPHGPAKPVFLPPASCRHAHWAVCFAHLLIGGQNQGIHGFLVRIRDSSSMQVRAGWQYRLAGEDGGSREAAIPSGCIQKC